MILKKQKYYKALTKDLKAPSHKGFSYKDWQTKTFKVEGPLEICRKGLHLYTSLENLSIGDFGERVFEAEPVGKYISNGDKICCREVKLVKELKAEDVKDFRWLYNYCRYVENRPGVYKKITDSEWAYYYCEDIEDIPEVYKNITDSVWACWYCRYVQDRPEVRKNITKSEWAYYYCCYVQDKPEIYEYITKSGWAYCYCRDVKDRPEVYKNITDPGWVYNYYHDIRSIPEVRKNIVNDKHI